MYIGRPNSLLSSCYFLTRYRNLTPSQLKAFSLGVPEKNTSEYWFSRWKCYEGLSNCDKAGWKDVPEDYWYHYPITFKEFHFRIQQSKCY